jgi:hypothetical protein
MHQRSLDIDAACISVAWTLHASMSPGATAALNGLAITAAVISLSTGTPLFSTGTAVYRVLVTTLQTLACFPGEPVPSHILSSVSLLLSHNQRLSPPLRRSGTDARAITAAVIEHRHALLLHRHGSVSGTDGEDLCAWRGRSSLQAHGRPAKDLCACESLQVQMNLFMRV